VRVQQRHIIYVQGYDPRGLAQYYRMFRTELRKFAGLYGLNATIGSLQRTDDGEIASWNIETKAGDWQTRTHYDFLRFEDLIQRDHAAPVLRTIVHAISIYWRMVFAGTFARICKANWRFAAFIIYPHFALLLEALGVLALAFAFESGLEALGVPSLFAMAAAAALFLATLIPILKYLDNLTYVLYLLADMVWHWEFAHGRRPAWDARIVSFAEHLVEVAKRGDTDEIVIVGHSSGSFLGTEMLAHALKLDPDLGRHGPRVVLLTVGGNFPVVGFHPVSQDFRDHLRQLAIEPSIDWVDCQSRKDIMNFYPFDPVAGHGIEVGAARRNPTIVSVRFREVIRPEHYHLFRWKFFRVHFQFVMANEVPHAFDFFMIVCGPIPLVERLAQPEAALAFATGDAATRERAWTSLEAASSDRGGAATPGKMEPSALRRG
jgi:hypothetical protein